MAPLLLWMERNLGQDLSLSMIARHARTSTRTLSRRFRVQVGMTPAQWLGKARVRRVRHLLETTRLSIERIAVEVGFGSASVLREHFGSVVGISPTAYRHSFRGSRY
jgi:transcriptional regulator GlxA family with amidase domain